MNKDDQETPKTLPEGTYRRSFTPASEIPETEPVEREEPTPADEMADDVDNANQIASDLNLEFEGPEGTPEGEGEPEEAPTKKQDDEPSYKLGGKTFKNREEAWSYAEELERQSIVDQAFRQGIEAVQGQTISNSPPPEPAAEELPDYYYTDPLRYQKELTHKIASQVRGQIDSENDLRVRHERTMNKFYSDFPDLTGDKDLVDYYIKQEWNTISRLDVDKGMKIVADKTRERINRIMKDRGARTELPKVKATASSGGGQKVTQAKSEEKPSNFVAQMNKLKAARSMKKR